MPSGTVDRLFRGASSGRGANLTLKGGRVGVVEALFVGIASSRDEHDVVFVELPGALRESRSRLPTGEEVDEEVMEEEGSDRGISSDRVLENTISSWAAAAVASSRSPDDDFLAFATTGVGGVIIMVVGTVFSLAMVVLPSDMIITDYSRLSGG